MFQRTVNIQPAPAVAGDFASSNPRSSVLAGAGALVAGAAGLTVGNFAWVDTAGVIASNSGVSPNAPAGFVHREQQAFITAFLGESSNLVPPGLNVTLMSTGDYWATNTGGNNPCAIGDAIYARFSDGAVYTGSIPTAGSFNGSIGGVVTAACGASFTATGSGTTLTTSSQTGYLSPGDVVAGTGIPVGTTIVSQSTGTTGAAGDYITSAVTTASSASCTSTSTVMNVTAVASGSLQPGDVLSGSNVTTGTTITAQLSGTAGSTGRYTIAGDTSFASTTVTSLSSVLNCTAVTSGTLDVGDIISGSSVTANSQITAILSGSGGVGLYALNKSSTTVSEAIATVEGVLVTGWKAKSIGATGELIKISTHP